MSEYIKQEWIDHIEDIDTGEILQAGTLYCARLMNHMEDGIYDAHKYILNLEILIKNLQTRVNTLEGNMANDMPYNSFIEDFKTLDDIALIDGVYNPKQAKLYY